MDDPKEPPTISCKIGAKPLIELLPKPLNSPVPTPEAIFGPRPLAIPEPRSDNIDWLKPLKTSEPKPFNTPDEIPSNKLEPSPSNRPKPKDSNDNRPLMLALWSHPQMPVVASQIALPLLQTAFKHPTGIHFFEPKRLPKRPPITAPTGPSAAAPSMFVIRELAKPLTTVPARLLKAPVKFPENKLIAGPIKEPIDPRPAREPNPARSPNDPKEPNEPRETKDPRPESPPLPNTELSTELAAESLMVDNPEPKMLDATPLNAPPKFPETRFPIVEAF